MNIFAVVLVVSLWKLYSAEEYVITRQYRDVFRIPASMCSNDDTARQCNDMGGKQRMIGNTTVNCTCHCNIDTQNVFGFFDNTWKCERNRDVRAHVGCSVLKKFNGRTTDSPLLIAVPQKNQKDYKKIGSLTIQATYCYLEDQFSYLDCNSNWKQMKRSDDGNDGFSYDHSNNTLNNWGNSYFERYSPKIYGRVIKLNIRCTNNYQYYWNYCVVLKVRGRLRCPIVLPTSPMPSSTVMPSSSSSYYPSKTTSISTIRTLSTSSTPSLNPTTASTPIASSLSSPSPTEHSIITEVTTQSSKSHNITEPSLKGGRKSASTAGNGGTIAGAIGGVAVLVIVVVFLLIMKLRRKRNMAGNGTTSNRVDDNVYEQPVDNHTAYTGQQSPTDDEYTYADTNNQSNNINTDFKNPAYRESNGVHVPGSPSHGEAPVYNTLEDPDYLKLDRTNGNSTTQNEPLYNVLENPETEDATYQGPLYDVLEGPNSSGAPMYDVLERPESDEQHVYGSLEAQDPHLYGSLNSPNTGAGGVNRGFDNVLYDTAGDVIQSGDIYQQLNQAGQQSSDDVYQSLEYPRMAMNELPESSQSHA